jgi:hypothetical protein
MAVLAEGCGSEETAPANGLFRLGDDGAHSVELKRGLAALNASSQPIIHKLPVDQALVGLGDLDHHRAANGIGHLLGFGAGAPQFDVWIKGALIRQADLVRSVSEGQCKPRKTVSLTMRISGERGARTANKKGKEERGWLPTTNPIWPCGVPERTEARAQAEQMSDSEARRMMLRVAETYERMIAFERQKR